MNTEKNSRDMNTEKNSIDINTEKNSIDINNEKDSIDINNEKDYKVEETAFSKLLFSIKSKISYHRLSQRFAINSRQVNLMTIVSIVPFFLTFYDFINQNKQFKLFEKNIPTFGIPTESLNWETFRYFSETKKDFLLKIEKVQWSRNSLFLTKKLNTEVFDQEYFIASFNSSYKNEKFLLTDMQNVGSTRFYLNSQLKQLTLPLLKTFYVNLDEVPLKLDNSNSYDMFTRLNKNKSVLTSDPESSSRIEILPFYESFWTQNKNFNESIKKINSKDLLIKLESIKKEIPAVTEFNTNKVSQEILSNSSFLKKQTSWFLEKALKNCEAFSISLFSPSDDIEKLEGVLLELEEILLEHNISSFFRRMSGYYYPDMNSQQVTSFLLHNLVSSLPKNLGSIDRTQNNLKIIFPANPSFINKFSFSNPQIPKKIELKAGMSAVKNWDNNKILYKDRSVFVDLKNGLDWEFEKTQSAGKQNLRFWFENYLSPINPLTHSKETIKGISFTSRSFLVSKDDNFPLVPFFTQNQWKKIYNENKNKISQIFVDDYTVKGNSLPVIEVCLLNSKYKYARLNFDINSTVDYVYSPEIFTTKIKPFSSLPGEFFNEKLIPVQYKKIISIFDSKNNVISKNGNNFIFGNVIKPQIIQKTFSERWEPLTFRSWLIVSQIGFAFLSFNFLKSLMSDYFTELIGFIIEFGLSKGIFDENIKQEIGLITGKSFKGFRIISKSEKRFKDIAGLESLLTEIFEIVWWLKNSGKEFSGSKNIPQALLLIGPPGTGKTLLVQAIAGEAQVPLLVASGGSLMAPGESGAVKLEFMFEEARQLAPCIVFIDEIDSFAQQRPGMVENPIGGIGGGIGGDENLCALEPLSNLINLGTPAFESPFVESRESTSYDFLSRYETSFFKKTDQIESLTPETKKRRKRQNPNLTSTMKKHLEIQIKMQDYYKSKRQRLALFMQLLIELDGLHGRKGVVVIGATNAVEILDSALLRPGRFEKTLQVGLPNYEKRLEIFKLYTKGVEYEPNISWEFLSKRTIGYSAADIATIMNDSCLNAIVSQSCLITEKKPIHTLQTIQSAIDRITTGGVEKPTKKVSNFFRNRVAYYQAGKALLSTILEHHPSTLVCYLWPRRPNARTFRILNNLQKYFLKFARRCELEHRIVGCYGGKAAEILFLQNSPVSVTTFGLEDLNFAFVLICFSVEKWYLYSKATIISQLMEVLTDKNVKEYLPEKIAFFKELAYPMELPAHLFESDESEDESEDETDADIPTPVFQDFFYPAWWQLKVSDLFEIADRSFSKWYRFYLPNPREDKFNIDYVPPDEFYHRNLLIKQISENSSIHWNDLHNVVRDYQVHGLVLDSFNKALSLLDENREYLDKLVFELLKKEVLNEAEIEKLGSSFIPVTNQKIQKSTTPDTGSIKILNNSFGEKSRRKIKNWIDFKDFEN
jgi:ATP-dependent Zn protease